MGYKEEALEFLGITKWHKLGYTGKRIKILSDEKVCEKYHYDVVSPAGFKSNRGHGDDVMAHIKLIAPDSTFIAYPFSGTFGIDTYKCNCAEYIKENRVHIFTTSNLGSYPNKGKQKAMQDCIEAGCIFFSAVGNDNTKGVKAESRYEGYLAIGGVRPKFTGNYNGDDPIYDWNDLYKVSYSSVGLELDYVTLAEILGATGTSFCSPVFAGMVGLVQQFFLEKADRTLYRHELIKFINDNLLDIDEVGFDIRTGYGLFRLPDPETIDISKYAEDICKEENMVDGIIIDLIPKDNINRPGLENTCKYITIHNTDNYDKYANAKAHSNYLKHIDEKKSWHYTVDDAYIIQHLPDEECGYHTGDGFTTQSGNRNSIGIEICVNQDGDLTKATDNAVKLVKTLMTKHNIPIENVVQHNNWSGKDCPHELRLGNPYTWETFINKIKEVEKPMENEVSEWAKKAWEWACADERKYLDGTNPKGTITREMLAQVLYNLFAKDKGE